MVLPRSTRRGAFEVSFPIDIRYFDVVVAAIGQQIGDRTGSYSIELRVDMAVFAMSGVAG